MDLSPYLESVRSGLAQASALADEHTRDIAERLGTAIETATRLALIEALSDAAGNISAELAPSSVELRMVGPDPEFVVSVQTADAEPTLLLPESEPGEPATTDAPSAEAEDEPVARVTLRLPQSVKTRVDEMASADGISTNAWLIRAVMDALAERGGPRPEWPLPPHPPMPASPLHPMVIPTDPFGPHIASGQQDRFGLGEVFRERQRKSGREDRRSRGSVQGWVR
jgi:hypothetical protein